MPNIAVDNCTSECFESVYYYNYYQNFNEVGQQLYSSYCEGATVVLRLENCYGCLNNETAWDKYREYVTEPFEFCGYDVPSPAQPTGSSEVTDTPGQ